MRKTAFILLFLLSFVINGNAQSDEASKQQVIMKMQILKNALLSKDSLSLSSLLNDDVSYGHSSGLMQSKAQLIRDVMSGMQDYKSIEPSDINYRVYGSTVVVTSKQKVNLVAGNKPLELNMYTTFVWIKLNGDWKLVARQSVKLPGT